MNQFSELFRRLNPKQRIILATIAVGVGGALYWLAQWNSERDFKPLLTGLAAEDAGAVTAKLKELNVEYRLKDEGTVILVPSSKVAETRLQLAADGLPRSGRIGFELFDKVNFGASEFTEQVNYQRAVEGELERSVISIRDVATARVHITPAKDSIYLESRQPAKASVLVNLKRGGALTPQNVAAITQLAASAVPGLSADQVSVMDTSGRLLNRARPGAVGDEPSEATLEYRKSIERDIVAKVAMTLEPLLGLDHFRTGVSADVDMTSGDQSEETYDPQKTVVTSSQKTEDGPVLPASSGTPGTASNIPNPTARATPPGSSTTNYSRKTENLGYTPSRMVTHTKLPQGGIRRLSLSVLVDHTLRWDQSKKIVEPPSQEKLKVIRDLVTAAVGFNMERGDQLVVEAFPFEATLNAEPLSPAAPVVVPKSNLPPWLEALLAQKNIALIAAIGVGVAVLLGGGLVFLWLRSRRKKMDAQSIKTIDAGKAGGGPNPFEVKLAEHSADKARKEMEALAALKLPEAGTKKTEVLVKHIVEEVNSNPAGLAHVLRSWLNGEYQR